jgi:hypothetical protein
METSGTAESIFHRLAAAHDAFFFEANTAWNDAQRKAFWMSQQPWPAAKDYYTAFLEHHRKIQEAWVEAKPGKHFGDALRKYRNLVQTVLRETSLESADALAMAAISQSLLVISAYAPWLSDPAVSGEPDKTAGTANPK